MDSGNSGSMQSSSGGDDEFDSPSDSISAAFLTNSQSFPQNFHSQPSSASAAAPIFDPLSNLFDPRSSLSNQNPLLNLDMVWSRAVRSDQIPSDLHPPPPNSAASDQSLSSISNNFSAVQNFPHPSDATNSFNSSDHNELGNIPNNCNGNGGGGGGGGGGGSGVRNTKKRPRASRRAPTTVLTTDTTNFRAMVQEFTGIPAPPFTASSSSSPFTRNASMRFDLFGGGGGGGGVGGGSNRSSSSSTHLDVLPSTQQSYLLRPFAQKGPFLSPSPSTFLAGGNLQNPIFDIQNMFQSNPKLIANSSNEQNLKMGIFDEFNLTTHGGHTLSPAGQTLPRSNNSNGNHHPPASWVMGGGNGGGELNQQGMINLRSSNGNLNGKLIRYAAGNGNSSGFLGEKAAENLRGRNEGMVEPWICSSD